MNESFAPPWFVSSTEAKQPPQLRFTIWTFGTSSPAEAAISSTDCRERKRRGEPVWYLVPDGVVQYIAKRRLYRGD